MVALLVPTHGSADRNRVRRRRRILQLTFFHASRHFPLNRFFYPDHSATSRMVSDLAFELASSGRGRLRHYQSTVVRQTRGGLATCTKLRTGFISIALAQLALVDQDCQAAQWTTCLFILRRGDAPCRSQGRVTSLWPRLIHQ